MQHPGLAEVAVHAVPSPHTEEDLKLTAVRAPSATVTERELASWSIAQLPYFAVPRYIEFRDELPRNPLGRVLKYQLREQGVTATTWDREETDLRIAPR